MTVNSARVICDGAVGAWVGLRRSRFIDRYGHVPYAQVKAHLPAWRRQYVAGHAMCEIEGCEDRTPTMQMVFDHCHAHGWVRGAICPKHNLQLGWIDAVRNMEGVSLDLGTTPFAAYVRQCPDCAGTEPRIAAGRFAAGAAGPLWPRVARPGGKVAHMASNGWRTFCGLPSDAMGLADGLPACKMCEAVLAPRPLRRRRAA